MYELFIAAFCFFSQNFGPFYTGPNSATLQKLTPLKAGVIKADKVPLVSTSA